MTSIFGLEALEDLGHMRADFENAIPRQTFREEITPRVLGQDHVDVAEMVDDFAVQLLRDPLIKAAIPGLHMEDWNLASLRGNDA